MGVEPLTPQELAQVTSLLVTDCTKPHVYYSLLQNNFFTAEDCEKFADVRDLVK